MMDEQLATAGAKVARSCLQEASLELADVDMIVAAPARHGYRAALATHLAVPVDRITVADDEAYRLAAGGRTPFARPKNSRAAPAGCSSPPERESPPVPLSTARHLPVPYVPRVGDQCPMTKHGRTQYRPAQRLRRRIPQ
jgi:hypothetical protein